MTAPTTNAPSILADDGVPLKQKLARAERREKVLFFGLSLPLLAFVTVTFIVPIGNLMMRSIHIPIAVETIPRTLDALRGWDGAHAPTNRCTRHWHARFSPPAGAGRSASLPPSSTMCCRARGAPSPAPHGDCGAMMGTNSRSS